MDEQLKNAVAKVSAVGQRFVSYSVKQYKRKRRDVKRWMSPKSGTTWKGKALHRWNMDELVCFFRTEVGVENIVLHRLEGSVSVSVSVGVVYLLLFLTPATERERVRVLGIYLSSLHRSHSFSHSPSTSLSFLTLSLPSLTLRE